MIRGARVTCGSRALVTADKGNGPLRVRSNAYVGAGPVVHRLALHPCNERWQERWISRTSTSSSVPGVGKAEHWATALSQEGRKVLDRTLPNDEERLRALYKKLADHGNLLVVVDQPATIGALAVAVAQDMGITVGYLPGLSMRRIADLTPGSAKTDAKDAAVIAQAARTMPHTLHAISTSDEDAAALSMLTGFDLDLARQVNQTEGRIRGQSFTQTPPSPRDRGGALAGRTTPSRRPVAARHRPSRPETSGQDKDRRQAQEARVQAAHHLGSPDRLGPGAPDRGGRRHRRRRSGSAPPGPPAHRPARPAGRCRRPGRDPGGGPPSCARS